MASAQWKSDSVRIPGRILAGILGLIQRDKPSVGPCSGAGGGRSQIDRQSIEWDAACGAWPRGMTRLPPAKFPLAHDKYL